MRLDVNFLFSLDFRMFMDVVLMIVLLLLWIGILIC